MFEVNQDHQVIHLKSLDMPESSSKKGKGTNEGSSSTADTGASIAQPQEPVTSAESNTVEELSTSTEAKDKDDSTPADIPWNDQFTEKLAPYLSEASIDQLKTMFLEGREPPRVTDSGWGSRLIKTTEDSAETPDAAKPSEEVDALQSDDTAKRGKNSSGRGDRGGRGGRGGRGRGRGGRQGGEREDHRKVLSEVRRDTRFSYHVPLPLGSQFLPKRTGRFCIKLFESYSVGSLTARLICRHLLGTMDLA